VTWGVKLFSNRMETIKCLVFDQRFFNKTSLVCSYADGKKIR